MTIINANKIISELTKIEEKIKQIETLAIEHDVNFDYEKILKNLIANIS